jgi:hypothetical protein
MIANRESEVDSMKRKRFYLRVCKVVGWVNLLGWQGQSSWYLRWFQAARSNTRWARSSGGRESLRPLTGGLTITEGKALLAGLQKQIVTAQVQQHVASIKSYPQCGNAFRTKGYYQSTLRKSQHAHPATKKLPLLGSHADGSYFVCTDHCQHHAQPDDEGGQATSEVGGSVCRCYVKGACKELVVGFDGGYVRNRPQRPERNFEVIAGKALNRDGHATRFAFVRDGGSEAASAVGLALRQCGVNEATSVTVLTDGDAGLRAIHQQVGHMLTIYWNGSTLR